MSRDWPDDSVEDVQELLDEAKELLEVSELMGEDATRESTVPFRDPFQRDAYSGSAYSNSSLDYISRKLSASKRSPATASSEVNLTISLHVRTNGTSGPGLGSRKRVGWPPRCTSATVGLSEQRCGGLMALWQSKHAR